MVLDQTANFVRGNTDAAVDSTQTTVSVADASIFPDPANGEYNLVIWAVDSYNRPDQDPNVEVVRATGRDTTNHDLTVVRGQEGTVGSSHPSGAALHLSPTSKLFGDIDTELESLGSGKADDPHGNASHSTSYSAAGHDHTEASETTIPNSGLTNSAVTVAGNQVGLGGTTSVDHTDLSNIGSSDHHTRYADSEAVDAVNAETSLTVDISGDADTVDGNHATAFADSGHSHGHSELTGIATDDHHAKYTDEESQDAVGTILSTQFTYDDTTPAINLDPHAGTADAHHAKYTDSEAVSAVEGHGSALTIDITGDADTLDGSHASAFAGSGHSHGHGELTNVSSNDHHARYTDEEAQDAVGTAGDATLAYDDANNTLGVADGSLGTAKLSFDTATQSELDTHTGDSSNPHAVSLNQLSDAQALLLDTDANQPTAGTEDRLYVSTDGQTIERDTGSAWDLIATHPSNIGSGDLGFDPATQSELDSHAGTAGAHHTRFAASGAGDRLSDIPTRPHSDLTNIGSDQHHAQVHDNADHSTNYLPEANYNPEADTHDKYTDEEAQDAVGTILSADFNYDDTNDAIDMGPHAGDASAHHTRYSDSEATSAVGGSTPWANSDLSNSSVTVAGNAVSLGGSTSIAHSDLGSIGSADHHAKTTTLDELNDTNLTDVTADTTANRPAAGTADRLYVETDSGKIVYDNATSWVDVGVSDHSQLAGVGTDDHHTRYTDSEATSAVGGSTPWANSDLANSSVTVAGNVVSLGNSTGIAHGDLSDAPASAHHSRYADSEAQTAVEGAVNVEDLVTGSATAGQVARSQGDGTLLMEALAHGDLSGIASDDHHTRYSDSEATSAVGGSTPWANSDLSNSSVTVAGNAVSLGGSTGIAHGDLSDAPASAHHTKYTDSEAVSAVNAETSLSVDISGDADSVDGYQGGDLAVLSEAETVTNNWTFERETTVVGTSATEDSGDAVMAVQPAAGSTLDAHFRWYAPDGGDRATFMYDSDAEQVRLWDYNNGRNLVRFYLGTGDGGPNFPNGLRKNGNSVLDNTEVTSSTNASGNYEIDIQGDVYEFVPE